MLPHNTVKRALKEYTGLNNVSKDAVDETIEWLESQLREISKDAAFHASHICGRKTLQVVDIKCALGRSLKEMREEAPIKQ